MTVIQDIYGEEMPCWESPEEAIAALTAYCEGDYGALTVLEIEFLRDCQEEGRVAPQPASPFYQ